MRQGIAKIVYCFCVCMLWYFGDGLSETLIIAVLALALSISAGFIARGD